MRVSAVAVGMLLVSCKGAGDRATANVDAGQAASAAAATSSSDPPALAEAPPPIPAWATSLRGKTFDFVSPKGDFINARGTLTFSNDAAVWSKDRTFIWLEAVDDVRQIDGDRFWIDIKAVGGGFDVKCKIRSDSDPGSIAPSSPTSGHKMKIQIGCPAGESITELSFQNGLPLTLKLDAKSGVWSGSTPPK